jgi:hypothetical protein
MIQPLSTTFTKFFSIIFQCSASFALALSDFSRHELFRAACDFFALSLSLKVTTFLQITLYTATSAAPIVSVVLSPPTFPLNFTPCDSSAAATFAAV